MNNKSVEVPADITAKVRIVFADSESSQGVLGIIEAFHAGTRSLNVGASQFCRALLILSGGEVKEFYRLAKIPIDPRDMLMEAEAQIGKPKCYFIPPFGDAAYDNVEPETREKK